MKLYHPNEMYVWDSWFLNMNGEIHLFHLQMNRPHSKSNLPELASIGHAISSDLRNWTELEPVILPGDKGEYDDGHIYTGCALKNNENIYLYYSSNHYDDQRIISGMCLAISKDKIHFEKHSGNPVIEPDSALYVSKETPFPDYKYHNWPDVDCRDISIIPDPSGKGWLGYVVMRLKDKDQMNSCCIALCKSTDLVQWDILGPCCESDRYSCFEVPEVFFLDGKWYMLALTGNGYGQRVRWADPALTNGTIVFESNSPYGPFKEIKDNLLLASNDFQGFSARTLQYNEKRVMFYTRPEGGVASGGSNFGVLSWPVEIVPASKTGIKTRFWKDNEKAFKKQLHTKDVILKSEKKWSLFDIPNFIKQPKNFILSCQVKLDGTSVGIAFNREENLKNMTYSKGMLLLYDTNLKELQLLTIPSFQIKQNRKVKINSSSLHLRLVVIGDFIEAYLDDELSMNYYSPCKNQSPMKLFCEEGSCSFSDIKLLYD